MGIREIRDGRSSIDQPTVTNDRPGDYSNSISPDQLARLRTRRLKDGALSTTLSKAVTLLVNAFSIPIAVRYLGAESFGVWTTISTILAMLLVLDLGVANSLTNFISEAYAKDDRAHASTYATTALGIMVAVSILLGGLAYLAWPFLHWNTLFHLSRNTIDSATVSRAVLTAFIIFLIGLPVGLAPKLLGGYQELRAASLFQALGSVCNLISILILVRLHAGLVVLVAASSASLVLANFLCLLWIWCSHKPWLSPRLAHFNRDAAHRMVRTGTEFFILQISALVVFNSDNLIVTHYLGLTQVASYSVAWRLVSYVAIVQTLIAPALWPAFSEAFERRDMKWVRHTFKRTMWITMGLALAACAMLAVMGRWLIRIWAGPSVVPTQQLLLLMCIWMIISTFMNNTSIVLVSKGDTRFQSRLSIAAAVLNLALSIYWVQRIGVTGVILGTIVSYLLMMIIPQTWKVYTILKNEESNGTAVSATDNL